MTLYSIIISEEEIQAIIRTADYAERYLALHGWALSSNDGNKQLQTVRTFIANLVERTPLK